MQACVYVTLTTVQAMNTSRDLATQSLDVAQEASSSLDQIANAITQINERNLLIATASEEQSHVVREVDQNLLRIRDLASQSSAGASQTASACGEMSKLAINLNMLVNRFVAQPFSAQITDLGWGWMDCQSLPTPNLAESFPRLIMQGC